MGEQTPSESRTAFATIALFLLPVLEFATPFGSSPLLALSLLAAIWYRRQGMACFYRENWQTLRWIFLAFGGYFVVSVARYASSMHKLSMLDGPVRLLLALSCIGFVAVLRPRIRHFWLGLCLGALCAGGMALTQRFVLGMERAEGTTHHAITFGDLSLAAGLLSLCAMPEFRRGWLAPLPLLAFAAGLLASILSGSRGGWVALPLAACAALLCGRAAHGRVLASALALAVALFSAAWFVPASGVAQRMDRAVAEVRQYAGQGDATTSVGIRLELWKASWLMFTDHPLVGVGRDRFQASLNELLRQGRLRQSPALTYSSSHNDPLHFLATGGLLDFSFLLLMYGAPLAFFLRQARQGRSAGEAPPAAMAGVLLVLSFIGFGLTDTMFWLMRTKVFYVTMLCVLTGFCLMAKENHDKP